VTILLPCVQLQIFSVQNGETIYQQINFEPSAHRTNPVIKWSLNQISLVSRLRL
jgi:hypothetical protein